MPSPLTHSHTHTHTKTHTYTPLMLCQFGCFFMPYYANDIWVICMYAMCCRLRGASFCSEAVEAVKHLLAPWTHLSPSVRFSLLWNWNCVMVFVLVAVGFLGCLLTGEKVSNPMDGDVKKTKQNKKKQQQTNIKDKNKKNNNKKRIWLLFLLCPTFTTSISHWSWTDAESLLPLTN